MLPKNLPVAQQFAQTAETFGASSPVVIAVYSAQDEKLSISQREGAIAIIRELEGKPRQARFEDGPFFEHIDGALESAERHKRLEAILPPTPLFMSANDIDNVLTRLKPALVEHRLKRGPPPGHPHSGMCEIPWAFGPVAMPFFGKSVHPKNCATAGSDFQRMARPILC